MTETVYKDDDRYFYWCSTQTGVPAAAIAQAPCVPKEKEGEDTKVLFKIKLDPNDTRTLDQLMTDYHCPKGI